MNRLSLLSALVCHLILCQAANSQDISTDKNYLKRHFQFQIGLNATDFIKQFAVPNNLAITNPNPYLINGKVLWSSKDIEDPFLFGIRTGFGYDYTRIESKKTVDGTENKSEETNYSSRYGIEMQHKIGKRWRVLAGYDFIWSTLESETLNITLSTPTSKSSSYNQVNSETTTDGSGPFIGIQFNVTPRIVLSTEMLFYFEREIGKETTYNKTTNTLGVTVETTNEQTKNNRTTNLVAPGFININFLF